MAAPPRRPGCCGGSHFSTSGADYELLEEIGRGCRTVVRRAVYRPTGEVVAVKLIDLEECSSHLEEVRREVQLMSLVRHPNLVSSHCSFASGAKLWIVMPLMAGGSVLHIMRSRFPHGLPDEATIATILRDTLRGLECLHRDGHIHRDVKAGNILIDTDGHVRLGDLGVAAATFEHGNIEHGKTFTGTPCWMAPEVMEDNDGYDNRADIWSFGITALELAHGHAPFSKYPPMKVLSLTLDSPPPGFTEEGDGRFSKSFRALVAKCLVKDPSERPMSSKLLEDRFFRHHAKDAAYLKATLLITAPSLACGLQKLKDHEVAHLAADRTPPGEHERQSQAHYRKDMIDWNFDLDDLKAHLSTMGKESSPPGGEKEDLKSRSTGPAAERIGC